MGAEWAEDPPNGILAHVLAFEGTLDAGGQSASPSSLLRSLELLHSVYSQ